MEQLQITRAVPTVAEIKRAARRWMDGTVIRMEAGLRYRMPDASDTTWNSLEWGENWARPDGEDNDLVDTVPMATVLAELRRSRQSAPLELDVYVYGRNSWDEDCLLGNLSVGRDAEGNWWIG